ncbi:MAG: hypothetical protein QME92_03000 [Bacillota bacterium]|nr:hypothetical protein [Bacillota bacterium]
MKPRMKLPWSSRIWGYHFYNLALVTFFLKKRWWLVTGHLLDSKGSGRRLVVR